MTDETFKPLDIEHFTRSLIEQAADTYKPRKQSPRIHVEPIRPEQDVKTGQIVYTYLNER